MREERIIAALDHWLDALTESANLEAMVEADQANHMREPAAVTRARRDARRLATELDRLLAAIRAGLDPVLAAGETRKVQAELAHAEASIQAWDTTPDRSHALTHLQVIGALTAAGRSSGYSKARTETSEPGSTPNLA